MTKLAWDQMGERFYETGVDHGVLYLPDSAGAYMDGVAWNGLTAVTEKPTGADANPQYADNIKYLNLRSAEMFDATIQAFTYPEEFNQFDGLAAPTPGVVVAQQTRKNFGLSYRSILGNDIDSNDFGYKLHLVYGLSASPSQKAYTTVNDKPAPIDFSWDVTSVPVGAPTPMKPTSLVVVDSTQVDATALADLETILYGDVGVDPRLPFPAEVITLFSGAVTAVTPAVPTYNGTTHTITIPSTAGVTYSIDGEAQAAGPVVLSVGEDKIVTAEPNAGYVFTPGHDNDWEFTY
jgi:hypothetical protein